MKRLGYAIIFCALTATNVYADTCTECVNTAISQSTQAVQRQCIMEQQNQYHQTLTDATKICNQLVGLTEPQATSQCIGQGQCPQPQS